MSLTYEQAKKLKDAGFPYTPKVYQFFFCNPKDKEERVISPTLSELIEACGKELDEIVIYITTDCVEVKGANPTYGWDLHVKGSTPEEAVANLYLKIKK